MDDDPEKRLSLPISAIDGDGKKAVAEISFRGSDDEKAGALRTS